MPPSERGAARRGRPRGFDTDQVIRDARTLFWREGLEAVSYEALTAVTGLHRPSIHAAFGNKRGLFIAALDSYRQDAANLLSDAMAQPSLVVAVRQLLAADITLFTSQDDARGCFVLGPTSEAGRRDRVLATAVDEMWLTMRSTLETRFRRAGDNELPPGLDRETLVDLVLAVHLTLATRARAGETLAVLNAMTTRFLALFPTVFPQTDTEQARNAAR